MRPDPILTKALYQLGCPAPASIITPSARLPEHPADPLPIPRRPRSGPAAARVGPKPSESELGYSRREHIYGGSP